ncbi:MAG: twin-arginine translocase TatA/TatE family subunit [Deltaproteobacteria bacterium]|nr:twin-arginine translocase TatA/TatE family subunit [Deltaproteobacteria bacterium]
MFSIGILEITVLLIIAFVILGPEKLVELSKWLGGAYRDLRVAFAELRSSIETEAGEKGGESSSDPSREKP